MELFNEEAKKRLRASDGAASEITFREGNGDRSVTLDRHEKKVLYSRYSPHCIARAGGEKNSNTGGKVFNIYDLKSDVYIKESIVIKYPKAVGSELRLYFSKSKFSPGAGDVFFIFTRLKEQVPFIGYATRQEWDDFSRATGARWAEFEYDDIDEADEKYQWQVNSPSLAPMTKYMADSSQYRRNPAVAAEALRRSGYKCDYNAQHSSFQSSASSKPYMEAHHLIPVSRSARFSVSLDVVENIFSLCPNCHRSIHFAVPYEKKLILDALYGMGRVGLKRVGLDIPLSELYLMYGIDG